MRTEQPDSKTIRFNVGGHHYTVSRSLIEAHQDTMLARLVSKTWRTDPSATIFIDRDGERFKYVLDYLRYGTVSLPITVSRDMFLLDMEFYGFHVMSDTVEDKSPIAKVFLPSVIASVPVIQGTPFIFQAFKTSRQKIKMYEAEILLFGMAMDCAKRYMLDERKGSTLRMKVFDRREKKVFDAITIHEDLFERCLAQCGLRVIKKIVFHRTSDTYCELYIDAIPQIGTDHRISPF